MPHLLYMTATPIPRTLALTVYGDLDVTVIAEMPAGRTPVQTRLVSESQRAQGYDFVRKQLDKGRQVYVVCPAIEESEAFRRRRRWPKPSACAAGSSGSTPSACCTASSRRPSASRRWLPSRPAASTCWSLPA